VTSTSKKERKKNVTKNAEEGAGLSLNNLQGLHIHGLIDVYRPIEAYVEEWVHVADEDGQFVSAHPVPNTRKRVDLPSLAEQWRKDAEARRKKR
jgi:hypothetical protein